MGKIFTARMSDGSERFAADLGMEKSRLFYDMTKLLEAHLRLPSGLSPDPGCDEHEIDMVLFIAFFEAVHSQGWMTQENGLALGWASYAAGMIENMTLTRKEWHGRDGFTIPIIRYCRPDEIRAP